MGHARDWAIGGIEPPRDRATAGLGALMTNPRLLLLDEATEGLAPLIRHEIWERLAALKRDGLSILIIDKTIEALLRLSDRDVILEKGCIVWSGTSRALAADPITRDRYLSV
jgi:branched-chain amino acid transport system ATP-binding protein